MAIIEMILFEATFVEFLIVILLLALLKRKRKRKGTEFGAGIPTSIDEKEKKDYERVQAILEGVQSQKLKQEISAIPQIEKNLEEFDKIAKEEGILEEAQEKPKGEGFFSWLKKKIKSWKKHREKAKQESLKREEERRKQEILEQRKEERKKKREDQIKKKITRINYNKKSKNEKIPKYIKYIIILIPLILIGYVLYANFVASHSFNSFYDIGGSEDAKKSYLSPSNRISTIDANSSSRNLISWGAYFDTLIPRGSDKVSVDIKFKDNFPELASMSLGAKDKQEYHYSYQSLYNPILDELKNYKYSGNETRIYQINPSMPLVQNLSSIPDNSLVASNLELEIPINNQDYDIKPITINTGLRSGHTFYIYVKDSLNLQVKKQDINMYNNSDELLITLYNLNGNQIANTTIPDDGITAVDKSTAKIQDGQFVVNNLSKGIYKLQFSNFDGLIREISLNTDKIITNKLFLADFNGYINGIEKPSSIYTKADKNSYMDVLTYHANAFQTITINSDSLDIKTTTSTAYTLPKGEYTIKSLKNDIIITTPGYLSFSKESYFEPFRYSITAIPSDFEKIKNNYDYVVTDYSAVTRDGDWIISSATFDLKDLYIKDGKLNMLINTPHLGKEETQNYTIPVDWINITVKKNGLFEKN